MKNKIVKYNEKIQENSSETLLDQLDDFYIEFLRRRFMEMFYDVNDHGANDVWKSICAMVDKGQISSVEMYTTVSRMRDYNLRDVLDYYATQNMELTPEQLQKWANQDQDLLIKFLSE